MDHNSVAVSANTWNKVIHQSENVGELETGMDTVQSLGCGCVFIVEQSFVSMTTAMSAEAEHHFPMITKNLGNCLRVPFLSAH